MIRVNDREELGWTEGLTVRKLLEQLRYTFVHIVVKVNGRVVSPDEYDVWMIPDGADVWVIHLIAGG
jgi:thiamine biosynthesis protein ThiS